MIDEQVRRDLQLIVAAIFAHNIPGLLAEESRLVALAGQVNIPPERVPALREAIIAESRRGMQ